VQEREWHNEKKRFVKMWNILVFRQKSGFVLFPFNFTGNTQCIKSRSGMEYLSPEAIKETVTTL